MQAEIAKKRALKTDQEVIRQLESKKRPAQYTCGSGLDYMARRKDGMGYKSAMFWVFTHHNPTHEAQPLVANYGGDSP